ncbi:MAG: hypothetical protein A2934_04740 [Candidatus Sungbacteria bacterium RIFCSPLOWO2_01_FULL_47_10]|uniref:CBS domain-containing protein n=1 Tax=Candidatus Sungbacteria bacterium RIFCSPLOWO2_01_FULL_47_10 TaxID=1802276 RepID=A0A1G2KY43_9BACT|nr:MAG: hypothetical protein A2934_04740 [Candidatus Sungbacteria bacterium RIFCSPLOWO2_01_FULL_47_10]
MENMRVKDFMTSEVVSVRAYDRTVDVVKILFINGFNGVPVVEKDNTLIGLITEFDFIEKGSPIYFSPMGRILEELTLFREDEAEIEKKIKEIISSKAEDVMNRDPLTLLSTNTLKEAADLFIRHHRVNPVPVVDRDRRVVGIVARYDLIKLYADPTFWVKLLTKNTTE